MPIALFHFQGHFLILLITTKTDKLRCFSDGFLSLPLCFAERKLVASRRLALAPKPMDCISIYVCRNFTLIFRVQIEVILFSKSDTYVAGCEVKSLSLRVSCILSRYCPTALKNSPS
jgi:hypothetical protein